MKKLLGWRVWGGVAVAALAAISVSFIAGFFYPIVLVFPEIPKMNEVMEVFLFIGGTAAIVAGGVVVPTLLLIGLPLYVTSVQRRKVSLRIFALGGFVTSLLLSLVLTALHVLNEFLMAKDFYFAVISILIAGPVTTSMFWVFVRPDRLA